MYFCIHSFITVIEIWCLNVLSFLLFIHSFIHSSNEHGKLLNAFRFILSLKADVLYMESGYKNVTVCKRSKLAELTTAQNPRPRFCLLTSDETHDV